MLVLRYYLWIAPPVLLAILLAFLWRRGFQKQSQSFVAYLVVQEIAYLAEFVVAIHHPFPAMTYGWTLLFGNAVSSIFELAVIYVLINRLLLTRFPSFATFRYVLGGLLAILVLVSAIISGTLSDVSVRFPINACHALDFAVSLVQVGMLLLFFMLNRVLRISWRNWVAGIALGFGVSACINLAGAVLRNYFGNPSIVAVDILEGTGFHICVVIWLVYFLLPERSFPVVDECLEKTELELWNHELEGVARQ